MLLRRRPDPVLSPIKRIRPVETEVVEVKRGRSMLYSEVTEKIWSKVNNGNGIKTKNDLEKIVRETGLKILPEAADEQMAIAALLHNKGTCNIREYIDRRGFGDVNWMIKNWIEKINVILNEIKNR